MSLPTFLEAWTAFDTALAERGFSRACGGEVLAHRGYRPDIAAFQIIQDRRWLTLMGPSQRMERQRDRRAHAEWAKRIARHAEAARLADAREAV